MSIDRRNLRWNGWGWNDAPDVLGDKAEAVWEWMAETFRIETLPVTPAVPLDKIVFLSTQFGHVKKYVKEVLFLCRLMAFFPAFPDKLKPIVHVVKSRGNGNDCRDAEEIEICLLR